MTNGRLPTFIMEDGLYQVTTKYLCAGFIVRDSRVIACAPILRKKLKYWKTIAIKVGNYGNKTSSGRFIREHH
jgi:hypothetical protein